MYANVFEILTHQRARFRVREEEQELSATWEINVVREEHEELSSR